MKPFPAQAETADPFRNLPVLRGRIVDPQRSTYRNVDLAALDRRMREAGHPDGWRRSDEEREASRIAALAGRPDEDLWVFAYGSLMWDPAFRFVEVRRAIAEGYRRSFCLKSVVGRGSLERPGLMAALEVGGRCHGLGFRIAQAEVEAESEVLWRREMVGPAYVAHFLPVTTPQGPIEALAFLIMPGARHHVADLSFEESARLIATGKGFFGTNLQYLDNIAEHFRILGIEDEEFLRLYRRACAIAGRAPPRE